MSAYTKGPWEYSEKLCTLVGADGHKVRFYGEGITICMSSPTAEERANWTLAKSAPELLEALKKLADFAEPFISIVGEPEELTEARAIIKKAEGAA